MKRFYQILTNDKKASIDIYGDITSFPMLESDVNSDSFKKEIEGLDVDEIEVHINSYGGEVAEAVGIYTTLQNHKAKVHTFCDGFACSAASIIFCCGEQRTMSPLGVLMIHNCMTNPGYANSNELRKAAETNDIINKCSIEAYKNVCSLSEEQIKEMMDAETWITAEQALEYGFATDISDFNNNDEQVKQSAFSEIRKSIIQKLDDDDEDEDEQKMTLSKEEIKDLIAEVISAMKDEEEKEPDKEDSTTPEEPENGDSDEDTSDDDSNEEDSDEDSEEDKDDDKDKEAQNKYLRAAQYFNFAIGGNK